jgi:hypothetical protein
LGCQQTKSVTSDAFGITSCKPLGLFPGRGVEHVSEKAEMKQDTSGRVSNLFYKIWEFHVSEF